MFNNHLVFHRIDQDIEQKIVQIAGLSKKIALVFILLYTLG